MGQWTRRKADEHQHDMPKSLDTKAAVGDTWKCNCGAEFFITKLRFHVGDQRDPREFDYQTAEWERLI